MPHVKALVLRPRPPAVITAVFYPDAFPTTTSVDGHLWKDPEADVSWADLVNADYTWVFPWPNDSQTYFLVGWASRPANLYDFIYRSAALFNTAALPDNACIISAVLSLYCNYKLDVQSTGVLDVNIFGLTTFSNTVLTDSDWANYGADPFSTTKTYAQIVLDAYNDFTLNAAGLAAISKTGVTKFGIADATHDIGGAAPGWVSGDNIAVYFNSADAASNKPKLTVTYEL